MNDTTGQRPNPPVTWTDTAPTREQLDQTIDLLIRQNTGGAKTFEFTVNGKRITLSCPVDLTPDEVPAVADAVRFLLEERLKA